MFFLHRFVSYAASGRSPFLSLISCQLVGRDDERFRTPFEGDSAPASMNQPDEKTSFFGFTPRVNSATNHRPGKSGLEVPHARFPRR